MESGINVGFTTCSVTAIRLRDEVFLDYRQFVVDIYQNRQTDCNYRYRTRQLSHTSSLLRLSAQLSPLIREPIKSFFRNDEIIRFRWCPNEEDDEDMDNGWADKFLSFSLFANLNVHEEGEHKGNLFEEKETPGRHFERPLPNAPKNYMEIKFQMLLWTGSTLSDNGYNWNWEEMLK